MIKTGRECLNFLKLCSKYITINTLQSTPQFEHIYPTYPTFIPFTPFLDAIIEYNVLSSSLATGIYLAYSSGGGEAQLLGVTSIGVLPLHHNKAERQDREETD